VKDFLYIRIMDCGQGLYVSVSGYSADVGLFLERIFQTFSERIPRRACDVWPNHIACLSIVSRIRFFSFPSSLH